ncbi:TPA: hypothetical protein ACS9TY_004912 [Salmonella enterica subsp. enterica serovar Typhi]
MTVSRESLVMDLHYASEKASGEKVAKLTVVLRETIGGDVHTSTLIRTGEEDTAVYSVGYQSVSNASDPVLLKLAAYFREENKEMFEKMMVQAEEVFDSGLNMNSTWLGQYGLRIASNIPLENHIPESVFA